MKKWIASLGVMGITATAFAGGDVNPLTVQNCGYDDGSTETSWKVSGPSGPSDCFSVDFDTDAAGKQIVALIVDQLETAGINGVIPGFGVYGESTAFPNCPDLSNPICTIALDCCAGDTNNTPSGYSVPCKTMPASPIHMVKCDVPGDSHCWLGSDTDGPFAGRSYFSSTAFATGCIPFTLNWIMRLGAAPSSKNGCLTINGEIGPVNLIQNIDTMCVTFWGGPNATFLLYLCFGGLPIFKIGLPLVFTNTGSPFFPGPTPDSWSICTPVTCDFPATTTLEFCTIYEDTLDTKPSGKPKLKISKSAFVHFQPNPSDCNPTTGCYGIKDDGTVDFNIWKVQNPAGPSDWFNVNHGMADPSVTTVTGMEIASWDFCGFGPCWDEVGHYNANLGLDGSGATPDINSPISTIGSATACMSPGSADGNAPYTFYDTPDFPSSTTTIYHAAVKWQAGDSCIWLGSDTDGTDTTTCAKRIPNSGLVSLWTLDNYSNPANRFSPANWGIRTKWTP